MKVTLDRQNDDLHVGLCLDLHYGVPKELIKVETRERWKELVTGLRNSMSHSQARRKVEVMLISADKKKRQPAQEMTFEELEDLLFD